MEKTVPALDAAGIKHQIVFRIGDVYISHARAFLLSQAEKTDAEAFIFLDHDLSWEPEGLVRLIEHPGDVVAGDYRFKHEPEEYMAKLFTDKNGRPKTRKDGTIKAHAVPSGFIKITRKAIRKFRKAYPELQFGKDGEFVDFQNHGAHAGMWWGEDFAFSRRWRGLGGEIYLIPDLNITHQAFPGNLHQFLLKQPGGSRHGAGNVQ